MPLIKPLLIKNRPTYAPRPRHNLEARNPRNFTLIAEPLDQYFERLRRFVLLFPVKGRNQNKPTKYFDISMHYSYYLDVPSHDTEDCYGPRHKIEFVDQEQSYPIYPNPTKCKS